MRVEKEDQEKLEEIKSLVNVLFETLPDLKRTDKAQKDGVVHLWALALADLDLETIEGTLVSFAADCDGYPTIQKFRRMAGAVRAPSDEVRAAVAWEQALKAVREWGHYFSVDFDDKLINAAIRRMGGWDYLCEMLTTDVPFRRKEFIDAYIAIAETRVGDASPHVGFFDRSNGNDKYLRRIGSEFPTHEAEPHLRGIEQVAPALEFQQQGSLNNA